MRTHFTGWILAGALLVATSVFAQGGRPPGGGGMIGGGMMGGPGGGMGMGGGGGMAGGMGGAGGCVNMGGNQTGAQLSGNGMTFAQAAMLARSMGANGPIQSGFNPETQQALARHAYAQQQNQVAAEKAQKEQERRDKIKASVIAQREKEQAKRKSTVAAKASISPAASKASTASEAFNTSR